MEAGAPVKAVRCDGGQPQKRRQKAVKKRGEGAGDFNKETNAAGDKNNADKRKPAEDGIHGRSCTSRAEPGCTEHGATSCRLGGTRRLFTNKSHHRTQLESTGLPSI